MNHDSSRVPKVASSPRRKPAPAAGVPEDTGNGGAAEITPGDAARYIGEMTAELAQFARRHELATLAYFLEMAHIEAGDEAHRLESDAVPGVKPARR
jgi:hypothetical protein